ncbi:hypothetical protein [Nocardiopsis chromatogenes]|uniref:hypothetical protein n=1 Tax=Nocardiopsis chromatogenes TaxID=280239 RepID=UPI00034A047C|nr:hypothetical protein [Nocardiopsis chromatogenes]
MLAAAEYPGIVRLLASEGVAEGPRTRQILDRVSGLAEALAPVVEGLHVQGRLRAHGIASPAQYTVFAVALAMALSVLSRGITGIAPRRPDAARAHADLLVRTLLADAPGVRDTREGPGRTAPRRPSHPPAVRAGRRLCPAQELKRFLSFSGAPS